MKQASKRIILPHEPGQPIIGVDELQEECEVALGVLHQLRTPKSPLRAPRMSKTAKPTRARASRNPHVHSV